MDNVILTSGQVAMLALLLDSYFDVKAGHQEWAALFGLGLIDVKEGYVFEDVVYEHILKWRCTLTDTGKIVLRDHLCKKIRGLKGESEQAIPRLRRLLNRNELASKEMILEEAAKVADTIKTYQDNKKGQLDCIRGFLELGGRMEDLEG